MTQYLETDAGGFAVALYNNRDTPPTVAEGHSVIPMETPVHCLPDGATPTQRQKWTGAALVWVETATLDEIKVRKRAEINAAYQLANKTSFTFSGKEIQADDHSMTQIQVTNGYVAITGGLHPSFPMAWKTLDNGYVAIPDVATWREFYGAIAQTGQNNFDKAQALKAQIDAATTAEQVAAIQWTQLPEAA